jgi:hypothetical protein
MNKDKFSITRLYVNTSEAAQKQSSIIDRNPSVSFWSFTIQLPNAIDDVVFMELLNATVGFQNTIIQLEDWGSFQTSKGITYWRYVDEYANNRAVSIHENVLQRPKRIRALKFTIMKPTGEPIEMTTDGGFEIEMYSSV